MKNNPVLIILILALIVYGCEKDDPIIIPEQDILGKWEITYLGNGENLNPVVNPIAYNEYLPDSILRVYNYEEERFYNQKYWIKDSLIFETYLFIDEIDKDTTIFVEKYKFHFKNKNSLKLDLQDPAFFTTSIYKRKNQ